MASSRSVVPAATIERSILLLRGEKVMLDSDLAELHDVETRALVQAVQRNLDRFPDDFMFRLTKEEFDNLGSQPVTSSGWGRHSPPVPAAFAHDPPAQAWRLRPSLPTVEEIEAELGALGGDER